MDIELKYIVEPEINPKDNQKEAEIYKFLHRSGDIIILGKILSENETRALFHCLSAGLKGLQTTHASKLTGLLNQWIVHYGIEKDCLNDLGIIVFMKKIGQFRKILSINELLFDNISQEMGTKTYYEYNPQNKDWLEKDSILNAKFLDEIAKVYLFSR